MKPQSIWLSFWLLFFFSTISLAQEVNCANGIDDDGDGQIDCFDSDCATSSLCQNRESNCTDGLDNDGDGLPDCLDDDCRGVSPDCPVETNCNNGIDDDGDGFFDYYDGDCLADPANPNDYIIDLADCQVVPSGNSFDLQVEWESEDKTISAVNGPMVADLDQDGIPEVVAFNRKHVPGETYNKLYILSGQHNGVGRNPVLRQTDVGRVEGGNIPVIGDIDGDGFGEIIVNDESGYMRCFEHDLSRKWGGNKDNNN
ncbi:MAG: VCBS repeat-containing protein, partial [Tunicatimonas sp.]|uniref:FG-GAP-like repeat-containing protein n=1 Tax=Tunicatimonas sp. TaxID=1940096 RepID=UPI003C742F30